MGVFELFGSGPDALFQCLVELLQCALRRLAIGDVGGNTDQATFSGIAVANQARTHLSPVQAAIRPGEAVLDRIVFAAFDRGPERSMHARLIVGMNGRDHLPEGKGFIGSPAEQSLAGQVRRQCSSGKVQFPRTETAGLQRSAKPSVAFIELVDPRTGFILAQAALHRAAHQAYESRRMERPFKERDVAEQGKELRGARAGFGSIRSAGQEDDRQVRPWRLLAETRSERPDLTGRYRLVGRYDKQGLVVERGRQRSEIRADLGGHARLLQKPESNSGIAPVRG